MILKAEKDAHGNFRSGDVEVVVDGRHQKILQAIMLEHPDVKSPRCIRKTHARKWGYAGRETIKPFQQPGRGAFPVTVVLW